MPHDVLRGNRGHHAVAVVESLFAREQERELIESAMSLASAGVSLSSSVIAGR
jgi:hypothetical protein